MDNQQLYYTYCSFDCAGKYYIGYTKKHIDTGYKGSYTAKNFKPKCRINLYEGEKMIAMCLEHMYHRIWQVSTNKQFVNKVKANINSTKGFDTSDGLSEEHKKAISNTLLNSDKLKASRSSAEYKSKLSLALKASEKFQAYAKSPKTGKKRSERKKLDYAENLGIKAKISKTRKESEQIQKLMKSDAYRQTVSRAMKNSEAFQTKVKTPEFADSCRKAASAWHEANPELSYFTRKISNVTCKIQNRLMHLFGSKYFKSLAHLSHKSIINEVQRLEQELVGYKLKVAEIRNSPSG